MCEIVDLESDDAILVSDEESEEEVTEVTPAAVLCVGIVEAGTERLLELLCRRHVSSVVDARVQPERSVAQLRRSCAARGLAFDWRPALSSRGSGAPAGDRAAAVLRLAAAAQGAGEKGWPCVLFAGEDWHRCPARQRLAEELGARHVELRHTSEKDKVPLAPVTAQVPALPGKRKRRPQGGELSGGSLLSINSIPGAEGETVFEDRCSGPRRKRLRSLAKVALAAAAAGLSVLAYRRLQEAFHRRKVLEQLERWTNRGPAKEPVVDCQVPVEYGADAEDVEYDVVEVPVGLAFECERLRHQLREKFLCDDLKLIEELSSYFEKSSENDEALLELPWIDLAALAQLTYWYDRRPRGDEVELPKEERPRDAKYGRWTKKISREKVIYSSVGLKSRVRTRGHLGAKVFRRPAGVDVTRLSTLQRAASLCGHDQLLELVETTMESLRPRNVARIPWSEVERHSSKDDLWLLIDGKVYDVTSFLSLHPGGGQLVVDAAAQDSTSLFEKTHGEGLRYSLRLLNQFFIGVCENPAEAKVADEEHPSPEFLQTLRSITGALHTFDEAKATGEAQGILR
ncbi:unnamed protein product [Durusdinium trenchii]|uniref:Cytochrome b5 heme-binding domain-containing protein n=1 Tax=Durusdinium trenchii TaxID=1381693 RepID=A0ABP0IJZ8_9DINO